MTMSQYVERVCRGSASGISSLDRLAVGCGEACKCLCQARQKCHRGVGLNAEPCSLPVLTCVDDCGTWGQCPVHHGYHQGACRVLLKAAEAELRSS